MIFYLLAVLALFSGIYIISLKWSKQWARWIFAVNMILIIALLVLFGLRMKIKVKNPVVLRRTAIIAVDVSGSIPREKPGCHSKGYPEEAVHFPTEQDPGNRHHRPVPP